jgi:hypothetical protein
MGSQTNRVNRSYLRLTLVKKNGSRGVKKVLDFSKRKFIAFEEIVRGG